MKSLFNALFVVIILAGFIINEANACTRVTYTTENGTVITGRSMDWESQDKPLLKIYARNEMHDGGITQNPIKWKSKYGSVGIYSKFFTNSGVNEKGLAADILYLAKSDYGTPKKSDKTISPAQVVQYILDNFASVDEAVKFFEKDTLKLNSTLKAEGYSYDPVKLHYIITDKTGDNAIIEYIDGKVQIHHSKGKIVLTNDPSYDKMLSVKKYFDQIGIGRNMPGSSLSEARFVYASGWLEQYTEKELSGYIDGIKDKSFGNQALMSVISLMRGVSTPLGVEIKADPNNTTTLWRTITDLKNNKFYFDSGIAFMTFWVDLNKIDFSKSKSLDLSDGRDIFGDITELLEK